jgi:hypothetical protein
LTDGKKPYLSVSGDFCGSALKRKNDAYPDIATNGDFHGQAHTLIHMIRGVIPCSGRHFEAKL